MSQPEFDQLLQKYLAGKCTPQEEQIILEWYYMLVDKSELHLSGEDKSDIEQRLWNKIRQNVKQSESAEVKSMHKSSWGFLRIAVAASFLVGIATMVFYFHHQHTKANIARLEAPANFITFTNEDAVEKKILLSDSTIILLQPQASISYPASFTGKTRDVYFKGNAFFKVYHNPARHFLVHVNGQLTTEVLGTSFNILQNQTSSKIEVRVVTGKVSVYEQGNKRAGNINANSKGVILTPNQKVIFNTSNKEFITGLVESPRPLIKESPILIKDSNEVNILRFDEESLKVVLNRISETYGIPIVIDNEAINNCHFTGDLSKYDLFRQLDIICQSTGVSYTVSGTKIIIKGEGCN